MAIIRNKGPLFSLGNINVSIIILVKCYLKTVFSRKNKTCMRSHYFSIFIKLIKIIILNSTTLVNSKKKYFTRWGKMEL